MRNRCTLATVVFYLGPNRRVRDSGTWSNKCRCCWKPLTFDLKQVEVTEQYTYYRCPLCDDSFPMRRRDVEDFGKVSGL